MRRKAHGWEARDFSRVRLHGNLGERYGITKNGDVYSYQSKRYLKQRISQSGYATVTLGIHRRPYLVHKLVAITYLPNQENKPSVNHINRHPLDNRVENLRWSTYQEQTKNSRWDAGQPNATETAKRAVKQIDIKSNHEVNTFESCTQAANVVFHDTQKNSLIHRCASGKVKTAYGYKWKFVDEKPTCVRIANACNIVYKFVKPDTKEVVYVGKTNRQPHRRCARHRQDTRFTAYKKLDIYLTQMDSELDMNQCEQYLIQQLQPTLNRTQSMIVRKYENLHWVFYRREIFQ